MKNNYLIRTIIWILIFLDLGIFFYIRNFKLNIFLILVLTFFIYLLIILNSILSKKDWSNKFFGDVGIGIIAGLIVSFFRDVIEKSLDPTIISMYILLFVSSIVFILIGLSGKEK